ncbi:MAG: hypothetical protein NDI94_01040 [Candidatus Woesearchaeota archaeon]|nr:hypothetical protein [Candidatus Woesearchaeota archaeon]
MAIPQNILQDRLKYVVDGLAAAVGGIDPEIKSQLMQLQFYFIGDDITELDKKYSELRDELCGMEVHFYKSKNTEFLPGGRPLSEFQKEYDFVADSRRLEQNGSMGYDHNSRTIRVSSAEETKLLNMNFGGLSSEVAHAYADLSPRVDLPNISKGVTEYFDLVFSWWNHSWDPHDLEIIMLTADTIINAKDWERKNIPVISGRMLNARPDIITDHLDFEYSQQVAKTLNEDTDHMWAYFIARELCTHLRQTGHIKDNQNPLELLTKSTSKMLYHDDLPIRMNYPNRFIEDFRNNLPHYLK